jgi:hypothetical protein
MFRYLWWSISGFARNRTARRLFFLLPRLMRL